MNFGVQLIFQSSGYAGMSDRQVVEEEVQLGVLAEELGFDSLWPVEHHFTDYAFCPDNVEFLAYMAARTSRIGLAVGAVILPWHQPVRVAERLALLDDLSGGRVLFGMGRGLARREYDGLGVAMDESRDRFDESARMVLDALETGFIEGAGPFYPQVRTAIRPRPERSFRDRTYAIGMSPDSVDAAADLGVRLVVFSQKPWAEQGEIYHGYAERFAKAHGTDPASLTVSDFTYVDTDRSRAEDVARKHIAGYLAGVLQHYELMSDHFKQAKGYEAYGSAVDLLKAIGLEGMTDAYLSAQAWGTPDDVIDKLRDRREHVGEFDLNLCFRYAGLPFDDAVRSMRTFAETVIPALRGDGTRPARRYEPSPWDWVAEQVERYEATGGQEGGDFAGAPVVILTTVGRTTGKLRKTPLMRYTDGTSYAAVAGNVGLPDDPEWYLNILAHPEVTLQDGDSVRRYVGRVSEGDERTAWWEKATADFPDLAGIQANTERQFPVVILEPAEPAEPEEPEYEPSPWDMVAEQVAQYEATGGREAGDIEGVPVVILTTVGRKTGKLRKSPVMRVTDGERYVAIGSVGGHDQHPAWYLNLLAHPEVTLQDGDDVQQYTSRVAEGPEEQRWLAKAIEVWPDYAVYPTKTDRHIPVVILEPLDRP